MVIFSASARTRLYTFVDVLMLMYGVGGNVRRSRFSASICLIVGLVSACSKPLPTYRYELVVEVETPAGVRIGSSIVEVRANGEPRILPDSGGVFTSVTGEAVVVDLPNGEALFALLQGYDSAGDADRIARAAFVPRNDRVGSDSDATIYAGMARRIRGSSGFVPVPQQAYPLLVRFDDPADPATLERVDPEDLASSFGPGTSLRGISIRSTEAPAQALVESRLPWISEGRHVIANRLRDADNLVSVHDFKQR